MKVLLLQIFYVVLFFSPLYGQLQIGLTEDTMPNYFSGFLKLKNIGSNVINIDSISVDRDRYLCDLPGQSGITKTFNFSNRYGVNLLPRSIIVVQRMYCYTGFWEKFDRAIIQNSLMPSDSSVLNLIIESTICDKPLCIPNEERFDTLSIHSGMETYRVGISCKTNKYLVFCTGNDVQTVSTTYRLQAYPNPFNPQTRVSFSLASSSVVSLAVIDVTGKEITSIYSTKRLAAGAHEVFWDGSGLASGIYLIQLKTADGTAESIKVTLLK